MAVQALEVVLRRRAQGLLARRGQRQPGDPAVVRTRAPLDQTGALESTGFSYDIGFQGSLGDIAVLGDFLLAPDRDTINDGVRGLRSLTIGIDGSLTPNGDIVDSQGITPNAVAPWRDCPTDINEDNVTDFADLNLLLERHLVSREMIRFKEASALLLGEGGRVALLINEEDHLRIQVLEAGLQLEEAWERARQTDEDRAVIRRHVELLTADARRATLQPADLVTVEAAAAAVAWPS